MSEAYQNRDIDGSARRADPHAMPLDELAGFVTRHGPCGQLTGDHGARSQRLPADGRLLEEVARELAMSDLATSMSSIGIVRRASLLGVSSDAIGGAAPPTCVDDRCVDPRISVPQPG